MKQRILVGTLAVASLALMANRPSLSDLQAQIDELGDAVDGIGAVQIVFASTVADTATNKSVTATCPSGKIALGGGFRLTYPPGSGGSGQVIHNSYPNTSSSWTVSAGVPPTSFPWVLSAYVVCGAL